jgi:hypothetical protein
MTNPQHKFSKQEFTKKVNEANGQHIKLVHPFEYNGVDSRYIIECDHGQRQVLGWQLIKPKKNCCQKGYHESRVPPLRKSISDRVLEIHNRWGKDKYNTENARFDDTDRRKIIIECLTHGEFSQWTRSLVGEDVVNEACPVCADIAKREVLREQAIKNFSPYWGAYSVSRAETEWLNDLGIKERQYFIESINYTVDGFDPETNTVYLYHGRFWHGCPDTYDPDFQHPILDIKMKDLYEKTMYYERKIQDAGYNLVTKWGT